MFRSAFIIIDIKIISPRFKRGTSNQGYNRALLPLVTHPPCHVLICHLPQIVTISFVTLSFVTLSLPQLYPSLVTLFLRHPFVTPPCVWLLTSFQEMHEKDSIPRQAVIIADSFNSRFKPITIEKPRCLLPLVNTPLINYTLQLLVNNGFYDIIIFCCAHADKIRKYVNENDWIRVDGRATIQIIALQQCFSLGDALREIDSQSLIRGPFVLVTGDIVSNMDLRAAMNKHQQYKEQDKSAMMTCVLKKVMPGHSTRGIEDDVVIALNADSNRLLGFQNANRKKLFYELDMFAENEIVDFRYDLMNTHICLCEAHVPSRFADHFDIQDMEAFIKGTIGGEELSGETVYTYTMENHYAARVSNLRTYAAVSQDVINRWVYPMVPDNCTDLNGTVAEDQYIFRRRGIYYPNSVTPSKAVIKQNTVIGPGTVIGRDTIITDTVIGKTCDIGDNVLINNSFIWDEVTIKDNCIIENAVLCSGAIVKSGTTVQKGCILSFDTAVGPSVILPPNIRVTTKLDHDRKDSQCSNDSVDSECTRCSDTDVSATGNGDDILGDEKWGFIYKDSSDEDDEEVTF